MPGRPRSGRLPIRPAVRVAEWAVVGGCAMFVYFWRLGTEAWFVDEFVYTRAGREYVDGRFTTNLEHPPLGKYLIGAGELLLHDRWLGSRGAAATAGVVTGIAVALLAARIAGHRAALAAAAVYWLLPHRIPLWTAQDAIGPKIERYALLDPFAAMFVALALLAGWEWIRCGRWRWVVATGTAVGLAAAAKVPGGLVGPVIVAAALVAHRARPLRAFLQAAGATVAALAAFAACYLPLGPRGGLDAIRSMWTFQHLHARNGHLVYAGGRSWLHAPWWANGYWQTESYGPLVSLTLLVAAGTAVTIGARPAALYLAAALAASYLGVSVLARLALPFYYLVWQPALAALAGIGVSAIARRRWSGPILAFLVIPGLLSAGHLVGTVATLRPDGYASLPALLGPASRSGLVVVDGYPQTAGRYLPGWHVAGPAALTSGRRIAAVVVDPAVEQRAPSRTLAAWLAATGPYRTTVHTGTLTVYLVNGPQGRTAPADVTTDAGATASGSTETDARASSL
jgi:4-amino-4-deoxy-L-arabinose transferase-like glycosyltransferase